MKTIKNISIICLILGLVVFAACTPIDEFNKYKEGGDIVYPAKVDSVIVHPGKNRIQLAMVLGSDPTVNKITAFWKNRQDSTEVMFSRTKANDTIDLLIENLQEGVYNFQLYTFDTFGNQSVVKDVSGTVFGNTFQNSIFNRQIESATCGIIKWGMPISTMIGVEVKYINELDEEQTIVVANQDQTTTLEGIKAGTSFEYRTLHVPDTKSIDTFYTAFKTETIKTIELKTGDYEVVSEHNTPHGWMPNKGHKREVTKISDYQYSYILSTDAGNAVPMLINVDPVTLKTSVDLQEIGNFGAPWYMTAESIESDDNFISYCDGIISVRLHIDNLDRSNLWGDFTVAVKLQD
ncbi:DUF4998 domain-containing protein [Algibacter pacificus]|uniref:DUF4998 domain-containing protein n=1 Tax=Algibacter pacificus TaxID=2599389 RepID=UPI0011CC0307|nr:DUF4998 domain-containing protein [Algibacter pacificus]